MKTPRRIIYLTSMGVIPIILFVIPFVIWYVRNDEGISNIDMRENIGKKKEENGTTQSDIKKQELLAILKKVADIEKQEKVINNRIQDFLKKFQVNPQDAENQYIVYESIGGVYLKLGYLYVQSGKQREAVEQFEKEEHIRNQYYPDLPSWIHTYDDNYLRTSKVVIPHFGSDLEKFRHDAPTLFSIYRPQTGNIDFDKGVEVVIPLFEPQIISQDALKEKLLTDDSDVLDYGGFIVFDLQEGKYKSFILKIDHSKTGFNSVYIEDTNNDGRYEITFSPVGKWDEKSGRYYVKNIYQYDDGVIKLVGSQKITEDR